MENNIDKHEGSLDVANYSSSLNSTQFNEEKIGVSVEITQNSKFLKRKRKRRCADGKSSLGQSSRSKQEEPSLSNLQNTLNKRRKDQNDSKLKSNGVVLAAEKTCHLSDNKLNSGLNDTADLRCIQNTSGNTIDSFGKINIDKAVDSTGNDHHRPCLGNNIVIPKRRRGASRRKKVVNSATPNGMVEGLSCSIHNSNTNACCSMLSGDSVTTPSTLMTKLTLNEVNEHRDNGSEQGRIEVPVEVVKSNNKYENDSFNGTQTKAARKHEKKKHPPSEKHADVIKKSTLPKKPNEPVDDSHEENLEEYAARMLSSRFAPSCTGFSGSASPQKQANGFSVPPSSFSADSNVLGSKHSLGYDASRVLRPRKRNGKNGVRKRRHFYEVRASDMDPFWVVERKIRVLWPLDEIWYFGIVKDYNPVTGLHHVKYVDREEEWIDLKNERFKLLMFPSEFNCKADFRKCNNNDVQEDKGTENAVEDDCSSNLMESEPIISWLTRSLDRMKPPLKLKKKSSSSKHSTLHCAQTQDHTVPYTGVDLDKSTDFITSRLANDISHMPVFKNEDGTVDRRYSLFYSRRRFHKRRKITDNVFGEILADSHLILKYRFLRALEFDLTSNTLKLNQGTPVVMLSLQKIRNLAFSSQGIWMSSTFWWLHFGKLMTLCPQIHLEIYFLDNIVGLKIVSFEGCLSHAVVILHQILKTFQHSNGCWKSTQDQRPFASIGFKFSHLQDSGRHLLFVAHYYMELESLKLRHLHKTLQRHCVLRREIPVSECTYANTKRILDKGYMSPLPEDEGTFLLGRHLKFLMKKEISSYSFQNQNDRQEFNAMLIDGGCLPVDNSSCLEDISLVDKSDERSNSCLYTVNDQKQQLDQVEGQHLEAEAKALATIDTTLQFSSKGHHVLSSSGFQSRAWTKNFGFVNGYRKPRTQVSYSSPFGGYHSGKEQSQNRRQKAHPYKKIRSDTAKKLTPVSKKCQRNLASLICEANVLVTEGDKGWREHAAQVLLDYDVQEWKILIKLSGVPKYSHKPHQILQPGATNRYTHAMLWKGGKNWTLEFTDRGQWVLFKEMHEECYNQNIRVASVKNIPIPGVHLIEENYDYTFAVPFTRGFPNYIMQVGTEVDVAMDRSHVIYDMDSDDEEWVSKQGNTIYDDANKMTNISCEMFENAVDMLEKIAYAEQCDEFSEAEIMCFMEEIGPPEAIKRIHEYWFSKRQKKGMALIKEFQPPLWEQYQKQLKEWELAVSVNANSSNNRGNGTLIEKPPMFAFCLKPRGLEAPIKGSKQRSHKKFTGSGKHSMVLREQDHLQGSGRPSVSIPDHESSDSSHWLQSPTGFSPRCTVNTTMANGQLERSQYLEFQRGNYKKARLFSSNRDFHVTSNSYNKKVKRHHADVEEYRLRDASSAAQHASNMAKLKREKAQWLMHKADLALNRFAVALMNAEAMKASEEDVIDEE